MTERQIIFSAPMVRALLSGTKTQTRRVVNPQPEAQHDGEPYWYVGGYRVWGYRPPSAVPLRAGGNPLPCPYGDDRLWVREAWRADSDFDYLPPRDIAEGAHVWYEADSGLSGLRGLSRQGKLRPSMFMPRWACRLVLAMAHLRAERLNDISEADAIAEGGVQCAGWHGWWSHTGQSPGDETRDDLRFGGTARDSYRVLWEQIHGSGSWDLNPWVWVLDFDRMKPEVTS